MLAHDMGFVESLTGGVTLKGLFSGASTRTRVQFFRYGFVAAVSFIVDFGSLAILASGLHMHYLVAAAIAFCLGLVTNYTLSTLWVFNAYSVQSRLREFTIFLVTGLLGLILTEVLVWFFTDVVNLFYLVSKLVAAFIVVIWNFSSRKILLYRQTEKVDA